MLGQTSPRPPRYTNHCNNIKSYRMPTPNVAIMYYSATGGNYEMARWAQAAAEATGAEVRRRIFPEIAPDEAIEGNDAWKKFHEQTGRHETLARLDDLEWADVIIFSVPTRYGNVCSQFGAFIDTTGGLWASGKLANKVVSAFTSAQNVHGGQETTLQSIYKTVIHWGGIIVPPGYTDQTIFAAGGNPAGASATIDGEGNIQNPDTLKPAIEHQVKRTIEMAGKLVG